MNVLSHALSKIQLMDTLKVSNYPWSWQMLSDRSHLNRLTLDDSSDDGDDDNDDDDDREENDDNEENDDIDEDESERTNKRI